MKPQKRKVLFLITKGNFGGAQRYVFDLATSLPNDQFDVAVACGEGGSLAHKLSSVGIRTITLPSLKRNINVILEMKNLFSLIRLYKKERPDVVHLNSSKVGGLGALAGRLARVPRIIFTGHAWAWNEDRSPISKALIAFAHWITVLLSHTTIAVSERVAQQMYRLPYTRRKIVTIHNGISPLSLYDGFEARQRLNPAIKHTTWIGTISELHKNKGLDFLIEAFARVCADFPDTGVVIVGEGEERDNLTRLIAEKKLSDRIHLVGFVDTASAYLKAFDIFTLTSRTEALPYVLLEAGLAQLPVIASNVGGISEIITHKKTGLLFPRGDVASLAETLTFLLSHKQVGEECGMALSRDIIERFSQEQMVRKTIALYT